jgi:RNA polymerase sigma factor (sigma-70 family)
MRRMALPHFLRGIRTRERRAREFDRLFREHIPAFYRSAYRWTGSVDRAEDLVQDLLTRLYPRLDEMRTLDQVKPWAMRVMYRIFVDQVRRERRSPVQFGFEESPEDDGDNEVAVVHEGAEPDMLVERELTQERILVAWSKLSEDHRVVLSMHDIEEYSLVEIARIIDAPIGTLKSRVHRARARLREILAMERSGSADRVTSSRIGES